MVPRKARLPLGAVPVEGGTHFRVWAPLRKQVEVVIEAARSAALRRDEDGSFSGMVEAVDAGALYRYRLDGGAELYPDPASRFQPDGPHGPSEVVGPSSFCWTDAAFAGPASLRGQVIYELHVGSFSEAGTWDGARGKLGHLQALGVTLIELMPIAEFKGEFGWGYDGVDLYAPHHAYGRPDTLRAFVDAAHALGIGVLLDVVYNHLGPDGNYLPVFSPQYFSEVDTDWGRAINYDRPGCEAVREFVCENAAYWIAEFHLDGLRLDATQDIHDRSPEHVLTTLCKRARAAAGARAIVIIAENESQHADLVRRVDEGGYGLDGLWNDDFHHSAVVALTGRGEAYYTDYLGRAQEFLAAARHGYLYQGQRYAWQKKRRGTPARGIAAHAFVAYLDNHDQIANSARSARLWTRSSPGGHRAMTALLLLGPWTPMLFQGQEWNASAGFPYFADQAPPLAALVRKGRAEFMAQFRTCATDEVQSALLDPGARETFERARLNWDELGDEGRHAAAFRLHRDLLELRRNDPVLRGQGTPECTLDGAVLTDTCLVLRLFMADAERLLIVNFGRDLHLSPAPEPLLAPPRDHRWAILWSSEALRYLGAGTAEVETEDEGWRIPGQAAVLLESSKRNEPWT